MATKISFSYEGKDYCLEYTRQTVKQMEDRGFALTRFVEAPMTTLPDLFAGAFLAHHKFTNPKVIDEIFNKMPNKKALIESLTQMYNEPIEALMEDADEGNAISWERQ